MRTATEQNTIDMERIYTAFLDPASADDGPLLIASSLLALISLAIYIAVRYLTQRS